jgi:hypothetical protein
VVEQEHCPVGGAATACFGLTSFGRDYLEILLPGWLVDEVVKVVGRPFAEQEGI